ncbi:MAG: hypothetical protein IT385_29715 [Deltaproteobacteria bacterium]|nr:hypothetical protein [Deltaproteobacteria bacterium]
MRLTIITSSLMALVACSTPSDGPTSSSPGALDPSAAPGLALGALDAAPRTIPYGGYVDFDGEPVNAGAVGFNFVIFPCATPGTGAGGCSHLWVARGTFTDGATWTNGWPTGAGDELDLPIFSGRFAVELGAAGQNPLPDAVFDTGGAPLYLGVRVEGRALGALQKIVPTTRTHTAALAESARVADMVGDLTPEEIATRRSWATSGEVAPGGTLELQTFGDATDAEVFLWEQRGVRWVAVDPDLSFTNDPTLEAYYPFDEESGTTAQDASGNGRHLTLVRNATLGHDGAFGKSINFGGTSQSTGGRAYASGAGMTLGPRFTVMYWIRPSAIIDHQYVFSFGATQTSNELHQLLPYVPGCGARIYLCIQPGCIMNCSAVIPRTGVWLHFAASYDLEQRVVHTYANGLLEATHNQGDTAALPVLDGLNIGTYSDTSGADLTARIDEFAVFDRALSPTEIHDIYRYGLGGERYTITRDADGRVVVANRGTSPQNIRLLVVK